MKNPSLEVRGMRKVMPLKCRADLRLGKTVRLPCPIEMFKPFSGEPLLRHVPKDEVGLTEQPVLVQVPGFAYREVAQQIVSGIRFERHSDEGMKKLTRFGKMGVDPGQIEETKLP